MLVEKIGALNKLLENCVCTASSIEIHIEEAFQRALSLISQIKERSRCIYIIGNGGSAATASHISMEILKNLGIASSALCDVALLSAVANDCGYERTFNLPLRTLLHRDDLLIALSVSGNSKNVVEAVEVAQEIGTKIITFSACSEENLLRQKGNFNFWFNHSDAGVIETGHFFLLHTLVDCWSEQGIRDLSFFEKPFGNIV